MAIHKDPTRFVEIALYLIGMKVTLPLWLQAVCGENILYAFNPKHLTIIEGYVSAKLRERIPNEDGCPSNGSMISRLPAWIKSAKNREDILKAIDKLWLMAEKEGLSRPEA